MEASEDLLQKIERKIVIPKKRAFHAQAYVFVIRSLDFLMEKIVHEANRRRHVTGQELSGAVRDLALESFGPMAKTVLEHWGIRQTGDIGTIVYDLIDIGLMGKTDTDRIEDFHNVYDFEDAFVRGFRFSTKI